MSGEVESVKVALVEALKREEGVATAERLLYAYHRLRERFRSVEELLEFVEENLVDEVEVGEHRHYPYRDDVEKTVYLRLKNPSKRG